MAQTVGRSPATVGYRIRRGNVIAFVAMPYTTGAVANGTVRVAYDDGTEDDLIFPGSPATTAGTTFLSVTKQAAKDGWIVGGTVGLVAGTAVSVRGYGQLLIVSDVNTSRTIACIGNGFTGAFQLISVGEFQGDDFQATWVFQGTVAEDATAGTHNCSLTITPGAGNELSILYGQILVGATATAQSAVVYITDGTNVISQVMNPENSTSTTSGEVYIFPQASTGTTAALLGSNVDFLGVFPIIISGAMTLVLRAQTAAVSVTQTFSIACRIKGAPPTATLADTVGTPVLTTNTNAVFG